MDRNVFSRFFGDRSDVSTALKGVGPRERMILELRFGVTGKVPMTLEQVGKKLRISRERVRQLERRHGAASPRQ